jgi:TM2 domain-containing membrane protein YozV
MTFGLFTISKAAENADTYTVNDQQVEQLFTQSIDVSFSSASQDFIADQNAGSPMFNASYKAGGDKNFTTALILDFFLGGLGIHRIYLGTKTITWVGYILTCGGIFGIVPLIDFIELIIHNDDISDFVDNPKFFMWSGN